MLIRFISVFRHMGGFFMQKCNDSRFVVHCGNLLKCWMQEPIGIMVPMLLLLIMILSPQMLDMLDMGEDVDAVPNVGSLLGFGFSTFLLGFSSWYWMRAALSADRKLEDYKLYASYAKNVENPLTWAEEFAPRFAISIALFIVGSPAIVWLATKYRVGLVETSFPLYPVLSGSIFISLLLGLVYYRRRCPFAGGTQPVPVKMWSMRWLSIFAAAPFGWSCAFFLFSCSLIGVWVVQHCPTLIEAMGARSAMFIALSLVIGPFVVLLALLRDLFYFIIHGFGVLWSYIVHGKNVKPSEINIIDRRVASSFLGFWFLFFWFTGVIPGVIESFPWRNLDLERADWYGVRKVKDARLAGEPFDGDLHGGAEGRDAKPKQEAANVESSKPALCDRQKPEKLCRPTLTQALEEWCAVRQCETSGKETPLVVVAAEGGASRGAVWMLSAMRRLDQATKGQFGQSVFAISGVSGGSLGAVTYFLALKSFSDSNGLQWTRDNQDKHLKDALKALADSDLLAAPIATYFLSDSLGRVFKRFWRGTDRGVALELAFERHWAKHWRAPDVANTGFLALRGSLARPHLLLNGVEAASGKRVITSTIRFFDDPGLFSGSTDLLGEMRSDVYASTAVTNSARFPYVSPAGRWETARKFKHQIVDGGYYENYGAETAGELLRQIEIISKKKIWNVTPIVVVISNDADGFRNKDSSDDHLNKIEAYLNYKHVPGFQSIDEIAVSCPARDSACGDKETNYKNKDIYVQSVKCNPSSSTLRRRSRENVRTLVSDYFAPLVGVIATRTAHGEQALLNLRSTYCQKNSGGQNQLIHIALRRPEKGEAAPLNWVLSPRARDFLLDGAWPEGTAGDTFNDRQARDLVAIFNRINSPQK
jgi:hypothetical protein